MSSRSGDHHYTTGPVKIAEVLKLLADDGWELKRTRGSHRQYVHPTKPGKVTVPGKLRDDLHPKTQASIMRQAGLDTGPAAKGPSGEGGKS
ncbi:MAG: type II toxin-antitoxin system HicA family toxin [Pseudonocardia sp.]